MSNEIVFDRAARHAILRGVNALANAVKVTLGPRGLYWLRRGESVQHLPAFQVAQVIDTLGAGETPPFDLLMRLSRNFGSAVIFFPPFDWANSSRAASFDSLDMKQRY